MRRGKLSRITTKNKHMIPYSTGLQPPRTAEDFEDFCHSVYMEVFDDPTATKNGRSGQKQNGVDIFALRSNGKRYGVQCKRKTFGSLTKAIIEGEVKLADAGEVRIEELIVATTAPNDVAMVTYAANLSDARSAEGKFRVSVAFWDTLETYIRHSPRLQLLLAPQMPGGAFWEQREAFADQRLRLDALAGEVRAVLSSERVARSIPDAKEGSLDKVVDGHLDNIKAQLVAGKFDDALASLGILGRNVNALDTHQRARWHSQRAQCYWQTDELELAAREFADAFELEPDDEKIAGNAVLGLLLLERYPEALALGDQMRRRFPTSEAVFNAWAQASERSGAKPDWQAVPPEMRKSPDVLHVLAWLEVLAGNYAEAAQLATTASTNGESTFELNALRLLATVNDATYDGVLASNGIISPEKKASLEEQISCFEPVDKVIWSRQGAHSLRQVVACLGYAYMMVGRSDLARDVLQTAVKRFPDDRRLCRICLESFMSDGSLDDAFAFALKHLANIDNEGKLVVAEMASRRGDGAAFNVVAKALTDDDHSGEYSEDIQALRWLLLGRQGKSGELADGLNEEAVSKLTSISAQVTALTVAKREKLAWADAGIDALAKAIRPTTTTRDVLAASQLFLFANRYDDVVSCLDARLPKGYFSEPHKLLFSALVHRGSRKQAQKMLRSFPESALSDSYVREDAVKLAQDAGDWEQLSKLATLHLDANPTRVEAWGFMASVFIARKQTGALRELLSQDIQLALDGPDKYQARLARLEIEFGAKSRGILRLYHLFRNALKSPDAASAFLAQTLTLPPDCLPESPLVVAPGCAVTLKDEAGGERTVVIDPDGLGNLLEASNFISTSSVPYESMSGVSVGAAVSIADGLGGTQKFVVSAITSSFRWLAHLAQELLRDSVGNRGGLISVDLPRMPDGNFDLSRILEVLKRRSESVRFVFDAYQRGKLTVGVAAQLLGTSAAVVSGDWPQQDTSPMLYSCLGTPEERAVAVGHLKANDVPLVVDLATVNELVAAGLGGVLAYSKAVYISTSASNVLDALIDEEKANPSKARLSEQDGRIVVMEFDEGDQKMRLKHMERVRACLDEFCQVVPAYGADESPKDLLAFGGVLDDESYDALLLALEKGALLLTLDGRLRELARVVAGIKGVWPQEYVAAAAAGGICSTPEYSNFVLTSLIKRRTHVSITAHDFMWVMSQRLEFQHFAVRAILTHFMDLSVNSRSLIPFVAELLGMAAIRGATIGALCRVLGTVLPSIFKRSDVVADEAHTALESVILTFVRLVIDPDRAHPMEASRIADKQAYWWKLLSNEIAAARRDADGLSVNDLTSRQLNIQPIYGCVRSTYRVCK